MPPRDRAKPNYSRRFFWLAIFIVVLFGGYSLGWFYLAGRIEAEAKTAIAGLNRDGVSFECANPAARGYPFRIGLFCDSVAFEDTKQGISLSAGNFRSAGQIYDPMRLVAELDGPAAIGTASAGAFSLDWETLRASVRLSTPLPRRISVEGRMLRAGTAAGGPLAAAETFEGHLRPNEGNLDLAGSFGGLALDASVLEGRKIPPISGQSDITITDGVRLISEKVKDFRGQSGTIRTLTLSTGTATGVTLSGPFSVDQDGLVDADLKITIRDPKGLSTVLAEAVPEQRRQIEQGFSGLAMLGDEPSLPLRIVKGRATLGFIPLGAIPPL
ncbi:MAG: DUF2125 domain-containing protein [Pseudaminobacter sp.]|nr:DUF2125 domain-containing protein [Pseudaminobacter sp.]